MIGIIVTAHNHFASGLKSTIGWLAGEQKNFEVIDFTRDMSPDDLQKQLDQTVTKLDDGDGVLIFTDVPGGTPFNQAAQYRMTHSNVSVITGTNVSMLMEVLFSRDQPLQKVTEVALNAGKQAIKQFSPVKKSDTTSESSDEGI